ncbi:MAG: COX15/CtaA family protein [Bacteroidota bacterium]
MYHRALHRFALLTAVSTFLLIFVGGLVTSTGSGLSVPDWPTTYGQNMFTFPIDQWVGGIKYEHGHRLFASLVGFLTVILTVWVALKEERRWVKWLTFYALGAVILQGILGGLTVLFLLPTAISVSHGMLAQTFFCAVSTIALVTSKWWIDQKDSIGSEKNKFLQNISIITALMVFIQLALGAILRHTYSGLSIPEYPLAYGQILPSLDPDSIRSYNQHLIDIGMKWAGDKPVATYQIVLHLLHRYWAIAVTGMVLFLGFRLRSLGEPSGILRKHGTLLWTMVIIQFTLGIFTVLTRKEVIITSLHVDIGALVLMTTVLTAVRIARFRWVSNDRESR